MRTQLTGDAITDIALFPFPLRIAFPHCIVCGVGLPPTFGICQTFLAILFVELLRGDTVASTTARPVPGRCSSFLREFPNKL